MAPRLPFCLSFPPLVQRSKSFPAASRWRVRNNLPHTTNPVYTRMRFFSFFSNFFQKFPLSIMSFAFFPLSFCLLWNFSLPGKFSFAGSKIFPESLSTAEKHFRLSASHSNLFRKPVFFLRKSRVFSLSSLSFMDSRFFRFFANAGFLTGFLFFLLEPWIFSEDFPAEIPVLSGFLKKFSPTFTFPAARLQA